MRCFWVQHMRPARAHPAAQRPRRDCRPPPPVPNPGLQGLDVAAYGDSILMTLLGDPLTGSPLLGWQASKAAWDRAYGGRRWAGSGVAAGWRGPPPGRSPGLAPTPASALKTALCCSRPAAQNRHLCHRRRPAGQPAVAAAPRRGSPGPAPAGHPAARRCKRHPAHVGAVPGELPGPGGRAAGALWHLRPGPQQQSRAVGCRLLVGR